MSSKKPIADEMSVSMGTPKEKKIEKLVGLMRKVGRYGLVCNPCRGNWRPVRFEDIKVGDVIRYVDDGEYTELVCGCDDPNPTPNLFRVTGIKKSDGPYGDILDGDVLESLDELP